MQRKKAYLQGENARDSTPGRNRPDRGKKRGYRGPRRKKGEMSERRGQPKDEDRKNTQRMIRKDRIERGKGQTSQSSEKERGKKVVSARRLSESWTWGGGLKQRDFKREE